MLVEMFVGLKVVLADVYRVPQWSQYFPAFNRCIGAKIE